MLHRLYFALLLLFPAVTLSAQTTYTDHLRQRQAGKGEVVITQSAEIEQLVNNTASAQPSVSHKENPGSATPPKSETHRTGNEAHERRTHQSNSESRTYTNRVRRKSRGYRICIFTGGNSRNDKTKALQMGQKCRSKFPELAVYTTFTSPRWVTNVGDFRTRQEAQKYVNLIRRAKFTYEVRIVSSEVNLPVE